MHPFEIVSEPSRLRIIEVLCSGEHTAAELTSVCAIELQIGPAAVSYHLRILREAKFVRFRWEGGSKVYRLDEKALVSLSAQVGHLLRLWSQRTDYPYRTDPLRLVPRRGAAAATWPRPERSADLWALARGRDAAGGSGGGFASDGFEAGGASSASGGLEAGGAS